MHRQPVFITSNQHKADYLAEFLGIALEHRSVALDEIQSIDIRQIVAHKAKQAYQVVGQPVLVEDVGLSFRALGGLPGPFVKFFVNTPDGLNNLCRMMDGFADRHATAVAAFGYYDGAKLQIVTGRLDGTIATEPRGYSGFGWDAVFCPYGYDGRTRAELDPDEDQATYLALKPIRQLRKILS